MQVGDEFQRLAREGDDAIDLAKGALLIVVGVAVDTMRQLEAQLIMRNYEGIISR